MTTGIETTLTDGVVRLRCLAAADAPAHLAGEDDDQVRWLSGGAATLESVQTWIEQNRSEWLTGGPRRNFGVYDTTTDALIGNVEANLALAPLSPGEVNISYVVFPSWRGKGVARRSVALVCGWLRVNQLGHTAVIRIEQGNVHSHAVPVSLKFENIGVVTDKSGETMLHYRLRLS